MLMLLFLILNKAQQQFILSFTVITHFLSYYNVCVKEAPICPEHIADVKDVALLKTCKTRERCCENIIPAL